MSIEKGLFQYIQSAASISTAGVSTAKGQGVYWILAPKSSLYPFIVLQRVATTETITMAGDVGFRNALFQVDCYASTYYESRTIGKAVRDLLKSYKGTLPDTDSTVVAGVLQTKDWDMPYEEGAVGFVYRRMLEFRVWYQE